MKNIKKYNRPAARVQAYQEHQTLPQDPSGLNSTEYWQQFDAKIEDTEKEILRREGIKEAYLEKVYRAKLYQELSKKSIKEMTWRECELWNDLQHSEEHFYTDDVAKRYAEIHKTEMPTSAHAPTGGRRKLDNDNDSDGDYRACLEMIQTSLQILPELQPRFPEDVPRLIPLFKKLAKKIQEEMEQEERAPSYNNDDVSDQKPVYIQNAYYILKANGDTVEGFASTNILDSHNQILPVSTLKQALPGYLESSAILLQHGHIPVAKLISYDWRKINDDTEGLYIKAKLLNQHKAAVQKMILNGDLTGFSVAGTCNLVDECQGNSCFKNITNFRLDEISLVDTPANKLCTVEAS